MVLLIIGWVIIGLLIYAINARFFFLDQTKDQVREYYQQPSSLIYAILEIVFWPIGLVRLVMRNILRAVSGVASSMFGK